MHYANTKIFFFVFLLYGSIPIFAADIGSDTAVNRFSSQVSLSDGDRIAGFAAMEGGFELDGVISAEFDSFFEVSGPVNLSGGTLDLNRDLRFRDPAAFEGIGNITGNDHTLSLSQTTTLLPSAILCYPTEVASVVVGADQHSVGWNFTDDFIALGQQQNSSIRIYTFTRATNTLTFRTSATPPSSDDVVDIAWHPDRNSFAAATADPSGTSGALLLYEYDDSGPTLSLVQDLDSVFSDRVNAVSWHPSGNWLAVGSEGSSPGEVAIMFFDTQTNLLETTPVVAITLGQDVTRRSIDWDATGTYVVVGTQMGSGAELLVYEFDSTNSTLILNASSETGVNTIAKWNPSFESFIAVGEALNASTPTVMSIYQHDRGSGGGAPDGTLTELVSTDIAAGTLGLDWSPDGMCLGLTLFIPFLTPPQEFLVYAFQPEPISLQLNFMDGDPGFFTYNDVEWSHDGLYIATADSSDQLTVYQDLSNDYWIFSDLQVVMNNQLTLQNKRLLFTGENLWDGNKNVLSLESELAALVADTGAALHIKNITIEQVNASKIRNTDTTSTITLEDLTLVLDGNFSFTLGQVDIIGTVNVIGNGFTLTWESDQELTLGTESKLILGPGVTFDYDPASNSRNLLVFTDSSSELVMSQDSVLNAGTSGINLQKGTLIVNANASLSAESSSAGSEIAFGDSSSSSNDFNVDIGNAVELQLSQGALDHKNVSSSSLNFGNDISKLIIAANTILRVNQTINTGDGLIELGSGATIGFASGTQIIGNIVPLGTLTYASI